MKTLLFWNIGKNLSILPHLACLAGTESVDVFILAECPENLDPAIASLSSLGIGTYREEAKTKVKVRALTRLGNREFSHQFTGLTRNLVVWRLRTSQLVPTNALIVGIHLPSKVGGLNDSDQAMIAGEVTKQIATLEDRSKHRNTVIVGDFNMHPYDPGMISVAGFHGLMTRSLAALPDRIYLEQPRRRFYNPMWGLFGDRTPGPSGTHYWRSSNPHNTHWGMLDQVLLRSALIPQLADLRILDHDGNHSLTASDDAPDIGHMSDHLPVLFRLDV